MRTSALVILITTLVGLVHGQDSPTTLQEQIYQARDRVLPALVHVEPVKKVYTKGEKQHTLVTGSGVIFSPEGYVITNHHVAENAEKVWCTLSNKERITATVVGSDPSTDIAVLKLNLDELKAPEVPFVKLGNSDSLEVGQLVLALGSPLGLSRSVSMGVISSIDRYFPESGSMLSPYNLWIQTDAAINPGNSGGPLINLKGEVVGINARAVFLAENLGFAIPINLVKEIAQKIINGRFVKRAWLGLEFHPLKDFKEYLGDSSLSGALVAHIDQNSPARKSGLAVGDVIQKINQIPIHAEYEEDLPQVRKIIADLPVNQPAKLSIWRQGKKKTITVTPVPEPFVEEPEFEASRWGMVVKNITWNLYRYHMLPDFYGVLVTSVKSGDLADQANLQSGDVIRKINGRLIRNLSDFRQVYFDLESRDSEMVFLELRRNGHRYFTVMRKPLTP
ncbi:MAG: PDZ domain-containing protein [Calditrichaeota bacterium]|nr:MAG: PDZ domain-containing protein [Calditrichota bacterium]